MDDIITTWTEALSDEQLERLAWLRSAKCSVKVVPAPPDPLHDLTEGVVLEVVVDEHAIVKIRGVQGDIPLMFDKAFEGARALFERVNQPEGRR